MGMGWLVSLCCVCVMFVLCLCCVCIVFVYLLIYTTMMGVIKLFKKLFFKPSIAFLIMVVFITMYLCILMINHAFDSANFLQFGPSNNLKFIGMTLDTWDKVYVMYFLGFFATLLQQYYGVVMYDFIHSKLWNPAFHDKIKVPRHIVILITFCGPIMEAILRIIQFCVTMTMQLQFLLPELLAIMIVDIPYGFMKVQKNKFISP